MSLSLPDQDQASPRSVAAATCFCPLCSTPWSFPAIPRGMVKPCRRWRGPAGSTYRRKRALPGLPKGPTAALRRWPATCPPSQPPSKGERSPPALSLPLLLSGCQQPEDGEDLRWLQGPGFELAAPSPLHSWHLSPPLAFPLSLLLAYPSPPSLNIPFSPHS